MKFRLYVDEVGNSDLESSLNPNHRFLSLTGVILGLDYVAARLHHDLEQLKQKYFGMHPDEPIVLHRKEIVNARSPFDALRDSKVRRAFDTEFLRLLAEWEYTVITVCIDKRRHKETYSAWRYDPYHYCLAILLERFVFFLRRYSATGDVMAESRGGREDRRLKASYARLWEHGTEFVEATMFSTYLTSKQLKVKPKANNIAGLQLADVLAHPSRNEILLQEGLRDKPLAPFAEQVVGILRGKYDHSGDRIFGKKMI